MCGIFGIIIKENSSLEIKSVKKTLKNFLVFSCDRGQEATGLMIKSRKNKEISMIKRAVKSKDFIDDKDFKSFSNKYLDEQNIKNGISVFGHTRIATNGSLFSDNQPIAKNGVYGIHNGIICNVEKLWSKHDDLERNQIIDTEFLFALISKNLKIDSQDNISKALFNSFSEIEGTASIGITFDNYQNSLIGTNCGSLYYFASQEFFAFASEKYILENSIIHIVENKSLEFLSALKVNPTTFLLINEKNLELKKLSNNFEDAPKLLKTNIKYSYNEYRPNLNKNHILNQYKYSDVKSVLKYDLDGIKKIKRCTKCILPETHPFIAFDDDGVCNYCNDYSKRRARSPKGLNLLKSHIKEIRKKTGINCIVMLSGGRDSCYALHIVKKVLKLNPVAMTYDWGMLTDLGRRNQSRMCEKLGVEHIIVSADIKKKRYYVKKNVDAFLHKPHLGTIGLFMAGDKAYHHYAKRLKDRLNLPLISGGSPLEFTFFKEGFSGIKPSFLKRTFLDRFQLFKFFAGQAINNRKYINSSIFDNLLAYKYYYFDVLDPINLFHYLEWNEDEVNRVLVENYNWEFANDTPTSWRIGDGTACFYNYIYNTVAGFTENDCFRSNQILEGIITRDEALKRVYQENQPRFDSLQWYCNAIGIDLVKSIEIINKIPKLYEK